MDDPHSAPAAADSGPVSYDRLLAASGLPRLDARALLEAAAARSREWLAAHGDEAAEPTVAARFLELAGRRRRGEPLAYLVGWREFRGLRFAVGPQVLIPRPETELLVDLALELAAGRDAPRLLDLGTGSGVIAVTLALSRPDAEIVATDASADALAVAAANAAALGAGGTGRIRFRAGSWWQALPTDEPGFDLIVSNPPYIAESDRHLDDPALRCEPRAALASGPLGLDALSEIAAGAVRRLVPGGWLLVEHGHDQGPAVAALLERHGFDRVATRSDAAGKPRIGIGRRPPEAGCDPGRAGSRNRGFPV